MNRVMKSVPWSDRRVSLALLIVIAVVVMSLLSPYFLRPDNLLSMTQYGAVLGLLALGQSIVILGGGGGIDLSVGSTMSLSGVVFGILAVNVGLDPWVAALGAIAAGAVLGGVNAALITLLRIPPLIATIATLYLFASAALVITNGIDINGFDRSGFAFLGQSKIAGFPTQVILVLLPAYAIAAIILSRTPAGRRIYETGNNAQAALLTGVNVRATRAGLYITSGALAGLAAVVNASWLLNAKAAAGSGMELQSITIAVLGGIVITGGIGRVSGTLLGLVLVVILNSGLQLAGVSNTWQIGLLGAVLIVSVLIDTLRVRRQRT